MEELGKNAGMENVFARMKINVKIIINLSVAATDSCIKASAMLRLQYAMHLERNLQFLMIHVKVYITINKLSEVQ